MDGQQLYDKYTARDFSGSIDDQYAQDLQTIFSNIKGEIFPLLETAEKENKRLCINMPDDGLWDEFSVDAVGFVPK
jgi:hypothetical protein